MKILELNNHKKYIKDESPLKKPVKSTNKNATLFFHEDDDSVKDCFHEFML